MASLAKNSVLNVTSQLIKFFTQLATIIILGRILNPQDFGLVAMSNVAIGLLIIIKDIGLIHAAIQNQNASNQQISNLFWINSTVGIILASLGILISPFVSYIYNDYSITNISMALSLQLIALGLTAQHEAILRKRGNFKALLYIETCSVIFGAGAGITTARLDFGYWSLIIMTLTTSTIQLILTWYAAKWIPLLYKKGSGTLKLVKFGLSITGSNAIGYAAANITPFAIGLHGGALISGLYNRANTIASLPGTQVLNPITAVLQTELVKIAKNANEFKSLSLHSMRRISLISMLATTCMILLATPIVEIALGEKWSESTNIFSLLSIFTIVEPIGTLVAVMLISYGRPDALLKWKFITIVIISLSVFIGSLWSTTGIILGYALSGLIIRLPCFLFFSSKFLPISISEYYGAIKPSLFSSALCLSVGFYLIGYTPSNNPIIIIIIATPLITLLYTLFALFFKDARKDIKYAINFFIR